MLRQPISNHERHSIITQLADHGKWEGERGGAHVRIFRFRASGRNQIQYVVGKGTMIQHGAAATVSDAVRDVNQIVAGRPERSFIPRIPLRLSSFRRADNFRLPYKDAEVEA